MKKEPDCYFVFKVIDEICDLAVVSILWLIGCLPIFTIAASTKALFYIGRKKALKEEYQLVNDFLECYRADLLQSMLLTLFLTLLWFLSLTYLIVSHQGLTDDSILQFLLMGIVFFECTLISTYLVYIFSNYQISCFKMVRDSFLLTHTQFSNSLKLFGMIVSFLILLYYIPGLIIILPGMIAIGANLMIDEVISKFWSNQAIIQESGTKE